MGKGNLVETNMFYIIIQLMTNQSECREMLMNQLLPSDLLITQMEVTFSPLKGPLKTPKKVTGKNLEFNFNLHVTGAFFSAASAPCSPNFTLTNGSCYKK